MKGGLLRHGMEGEMRRRARGREGRNGEAENRDYKRSDVPGGVGSDPHHGIIYVCIQLLSIDGRGDAVLTSPLSRSFCCVCQFE